MTRAWKTRHVIYGGLLLLLLLYMLPYEQNPYTCVTCRLYKSVTSYCGIPFTFYERSECSLWFSDAYPDHTHHWRRSACTCRRSGCSVTMILPRRHPVFQVPASHQLAYLKASSPEQIQEFLTLVESEVDEDNEKAKALIQDFLYATPANHSTKRARQPGASAD
jgi:hypothetical protein